MAISLVKGQNVSLVKAAADAGASLDSVTVGLGWDPISGRGSFDLDAAAFVLGEDDKVLGKDWFVWYRNYNAPKKVVAHTGDNLTGAGDGDDEQIRVDLVNLRQVAQQKAGKAVKKVLFVVNIYQAGRKGQSFGDIQNAFIRITDSRGVELARYDLGREFSKETIVSFGEIYDYNGGWKFRAVGQGVQKELEELCRDFGA